MRFLTWYSQASVFHISKQIFALLGHILIFLNNILWCRRVSHVPIIGPMFSVYYSMAEERVLGWRINTKIVQSIRAIHRHVMRMISSIQFSTITHIAIRSRSLYNSSLYQWRRQWTSKISKLLFRFYGYHKPSTNEMQLLVIAFAHRIKAMTWLDNV